jgi:hypothetical protein
MRFKYAIQSERFFHRLAGGFLALACCSLSYAQALPDWQLVPKVEQTAQGSRITYSGVGEPVQTLGRTATAAANDTLSVTDRAVIQTAAGPAEVSATRSAAGSLARGALARGLLKAAAGGLAGAAAAAAGEYILGAGKQWMLDQGYEEGPDGNFYPKRNTPPAPPSDTTYFGYGPYYCYGAVCNLQQGVAFQQAYGSYSVLEYWSNIKYSADGTYGWVDIAAWKNLSDRNSKDPDIVKTEYRYYKPIQACASGYVVAPGEACPMAPPPPSLNDGFIDGAAGSAPWPSGDLLPMLDAADALGVPIPLGDAVSLSGPESLQSSPVQRAVYTTNAAGNTQTVTETQAIHSNLAYSGNTVTESSTLNTTKTNAQTGETTTEQVNLAVKPDMCKGLSILACIELGAIPGDAVPKSTKSIEYQAESISLPSGCPADIQVGRFGSLSFSSACSAAGSMRPLIIAGAAFIALMICVTAVAGVRP